MRRLGKVLLALAARAYLGKPLAALDEDEMAGLVGMIKAPNAFHPVRNGRPIRRAWRG